MLHRSRSPVATRLLASVALLALSAGAAWAVEPSTPPAETAVKTCQAGCIPEADRVRPPSRGAQAAIARRDVLGEEGFYLESNELVDDRDNERFIARGEVEARYQGRVVRADEVEYRTRTGLVVARGNARILNADGTIQAADEITLDENFSAGVAVGFSTQLEQDVKIVAASAVRRSETVTDLNRAVYTPCPVCSPEGEPKTPTFSLQAERVIQDRNRRAIYYRNAVLRIKGVPVLYAPVFFHPDPTAERASGFLVPDIGISSKRGFTYEQPYLWAISPSQELVISPQVNSKVNPFLNLFYRKRFWSGEMEARAGYTYEEDFDGDGERFGDLTSRSYLLANGEFQLTENWRYGFTAERTSDPLIFDKYDIGDVYVDDRGLFQSDDKRLLSQLYAVRSTERSYVSVTALSFQGLRPRDDDAAFPLVAPLVEARYEPANTFAGGRLRLRGSGVALFRKGEIDPRRRDIAVVQDLDSSRATVEADWRRPMTFANGLRVEPLALIRGDAYRIGDRPAAAAVDSDIRYGESFARYNVTVGAEVSYPLYRPTRTGSILLEPVAQVLISPDADDSDDVPNEDSLVLSFDETNLFDTNRYPGFDRYEGGQRLNVGGRATWALGGVREATVFVGRSFRADEDLSYAPTSGLRESASDYVVAASAIPITGLSVSGRARLDGQTGEVRRSEAALNASLGRVRGFARYYYDDANPTGNREHEVSAGGEFKFRRNWGVTGQVVHDLETSVARRRDIGVFYEDECLRFDVVYEREDTINRRFGPSNSISVRLSLATLGATGSRDYD
jgi:LPS-assembly protein